MSLSVLRNLPVIRWAVLEHQTNGDRSLIAFDCELIRDNTCLNMGLVWIDRSQGESLIKLAPRKEDRPIIVVNFPEPLKNQATAQIIDNAIFRIDSIID
jgi:hypothetical protein